MYRPGSHTNSSHVDVLLLRPLACIFVSSLPLPATMTQPDVLLNIGGQRSRYEENYFGTRVMQAATGQK